jgi:nitrite reductase/ring-hydroxylating ferredoxin subunit
VAFRRAAALAEIPEDRGLRVRMGSAELALFRVGERLYAIEDPCPHAGFPLSEGQLDGSVVICGAHGWEFDLATGASTLDPDTPLIQCFAVRVEGGDVWVDVGEAGGKP